MKVGSLAPFRFKCLLDAYKGYHQIRMARSDEDQMAFHTDIGVFCYTKMPFIIKNTGTTCQRMMDKLFAKQIRKNMEVYVDDLVLRRLELSGACADTSRRMWWGC
jgi:hypothetical protein